MTKTTLEIIRNTYPEVRYVEYNDKVWYSQDEVDKILNTINESDLESCYKQIQDSVKQERERILKIIKHFKNKNNDALINVSWLINHINSQSSSAVSEVKK